MCLSEREARPGAGVELLDPDVLPFARELAKRHHRTIRRDRPSLVRVDAALERPVRVHRRSLSAAGSPIEAQRQSRRATSTPRGVKQLPSSASDQKLASSITATGVPSVSIFLGSNRTAIMVPSAVPYTRWPEGRYFGPPPSTMNFNFPAVEIQPADLHSVRPEDHEQSIPRVWQNVIDDVLEIPVVEPRDVLDGSACRWDANCAGVCGGVHEPVGAPLRGGAADDRAHGPP